jgi:predicted nucleotidyltransferase
VLFDLMPVAADVLGFTNRWYPYAVDSAEEVEIEPCLRIRVATAVAFVATKLEAFADRGRGDPMTSHDLEDVLNIVDGREELAAELTAAPPALQAAVRGAFRTLLADPDFASLLPGLVIDPQRAATVAQRLRDMSA